MTECAWIACTEPARWRGVCTGHFGRTMGAGRRARWGIDPETVHKTIARYDRPAAEPRTPVPDRLDDLEWLLGLGEWPERAAARCGWDREYAITVARRNGRPDIAERLMIREPAA